MLACDFALVRDELDAFARTIRMRTANGGRGSVTLKAIIGTGRLDDKRKKLACKIVELAEVDFAQTGANGAPATVHDVELLRDFLPEAVGVKASGGVETLEDALAMINAGAGRIGSPSRSRSSRTRQASTASLREPLQTGDLRGGRDLRRPRARR